MIFREELNKAALSKMPPGSHVILRSKTPWKGLEGRFLGWELRDTVLIQSASVLRYAFLFRSPVEGTVAENVLRYGVGALNIDGCRIGFVGGSGTPSGFDRLNASNAENGYRPSSYEKGAPLAPMAAGRWPTNLVFVHEAGCRKAGTKEVAAPVINRFVDGMKPFGNGAGHAYESSGGGIEQVVVWKCVEGCPVQALESQGAAMGMHSPGSARAGSANPRPVIYTGAVPIVPPTNTGDMFRYGDAGGASRFFPQFANDTELEAWLLRLISGP